MLFETNADLAITNGGGIRASIEVEENGKVLVKIYNSNTKNNEPIAILEVKGITIDDLKALINEVYSEIEDTENGGSNDTNQESNNGNSDINNGNQGNNTENQGSNAGNDDNNNESQENNNQNTNKPLNPQTGDVSVLGYIGIGLTAVAGVFATNIRRKQK